MYSEEESDEIYDEIDRHDMSLDIPDEQGERRRRKREEILNVEGDSSDVDADEGSDDDENSAFSDSDSDKDDLSNIEKLLPSADQWGSGRKSFYNTSFVDQDWGGMNEAEAELAELEEEDAIARQRKLDAALGHVHMHFQDDIQEKEAVSGLDEPQDFGSTPAEEQFQYFLKVNPDLKQLFAEYQKMRMYFVNDVLPLSDIARAIKHFRPGLVLEKQLLLAVNVFSRYLTNLLFAIHMKITGNSSQQALRYIDHPVLDVISTFRKEVNVVMHFLASKKTTLQMIREMVGSSSLTHFLDALPTVEDIQKSKRLPEKIEKDEPLFEVEEVDAEVQGAEDNRMEEEITKRLITSQIEKNKGLQKKRKKGTQHSRVKKRKQYKKALIKRRSQKPDVRKELVPYGGETRGIRVSTVKSVKLRA